jgi:hypothetical protein
MNSCGLEALNNTNFTTNREWTRVVWKHWTTQTPLQTGSELVWSGSIEQHKLHYKQGVNSCGLEASAVSALLLTFIVLLMLQIQS